MRKEPHAPFCVCCFLFYFPICPFWGGWRTVCSRERLFRGARGEKETQMPSLFLCLSPSLHLIKNALLPVSVLFFCFFVVSHFSLLCFFLPHTHPRHGETSEPQTAGGNVPCASSEVVRSFCSMCLFWWKRRQRHCVWKATRCKRKVPTRSSV